MQRLELEERIFGMILGVAIGTVVGLLVRRRQSDSLDEDRRDSQAEAPSQMISG